MGPDRQEPVGSVSRPRPGPGEVITMYRFWAVLLLAVLSAGPAAAQADKKDQVFRIAAKLTRDDPKDTKQNSPCKIHVVRMEAGSQYTIDMVSTQFDSYLRLEDKRGRELAFDDDSGGNLNARIVFDCNRTDDYRVICTVVGGGAGDYVMTVKKSGKELKTVGSHAKLLGQAAPELKADFALNGKPVRLADLKGKVVLLNFWEVRSAPSVAMLSKLRELDKAHKKAGLEVVGVTFYNFELGHGLGFDKEAGRVTDVPKATKEAEQAVLKEFAAHHKLNYLLLALGGQDAMKAFDTYVVNGLPQFVVIDRKGVVRAVNVGDTDKIGPALEAEIKKLLAEN
jgi:peroxiredoxin